MSTPKTRTWVDGLENLGENLVRMAISLKGLEEAAPAASSDITFEGAVTKLAEAFGLAFRQAHPVLVSGENAFVQLVAEGELKSLASDLREKHPHRAGTLVHEAILCSQEMVSLMARIAQAGRANAPRTREVLQPSLPKFADSASVIGWELKSICHEFRAEVKLLGRAPTSFRDFGAGTGALVGDMMEIARKLRSARKDWFRMDHQLRAAMDA